jgi:hypothetical protein
MVVLRRFGPAMRTELANGIGSTPAARNATRRHATLLPLVASALAGLAFISVQFFVERRAASSLATPHSHFDVEWSTFRFQFAGDVARFLGLSLAGIALVIRGRRRTFWIPAVAYVCAPLLFGWGDHDCQFLGRLPAAVGSGWRPFTFGCESSVAAGWGPAILELALVLVPALALTIAIGVGSANGFTRVPAQVGSGKLTAFDLASLGFVIFAVGAVLWAWGLAGTRPSPLLAQLPKGLPLVAFGLLFASLRPRVAWILPVVAALLATGWASLAMAGAAFSQAGLSGVVSSLPYTLPFLALPVLAAAWEPLSDWTQSLADSPRRGVALLNVMNVADAAFTAFAVRNEGAVEANPFVRAIGLPAKVVLVGGLSLLLFRFRPRAIAWLNLAFACLLVWHVAGFWASPR